MNTKIYVICAHVGGATIPYEAFSDEGKASFQLGLLRSNAIQGVGYSLQYVPFKDERNNFSKSAKGA